jgi:hypothetical protein
MKKWKERSIRRREERLRAKEKSSPMKKLILIAIVIAVGFGVLFLINQSGSDSNSAQYNKSAGNLTAENNVSVVDGKQIITINAKGGYNPRKSSAKSGIPTVLKVVTNGTYDCSSAIRIPSLKYSANLPPSGETEIDLGQPATGKLAGSCGMGMYFFEIDFTA